MKTREWDGERRFPPHYLTSHLLVRRGDSGSAPDSESPVNPGTDARMTEVKGACAMSKMVLGLLCGVGFGVVDVLVMIPLQFEDRTAAMTGAFFNRFAIGFVIGATDLPVAGWVRGLLFGLLLSLPDAIITKAWAPIMGIGAIGGVIIGFIVSKWGV